MNLHFIKYSATGNIIGVAYYSDVFDIEEFVNNSEARKNLKGLAVKNFCDSVMVLIKNHQSILQTIVFEPNSGSDYGVFSTMCGNGVRAIAKYAEENLKFSNWPLLLNTKSGTLQIEKLRGNTYRVLMGNIVTSKSALSSYVNKAHFSENSDLTGIKIPPTLLDKINTLNFSPHGAICSVGFNTTEIDIYKADGEPHMIIELDRNYIKNIKELKLIAQKYGPVICESKDLFPLGININFIVQGEDGELFLVCTYERNLGDDPEKSVTQACGTGCTFVGAEQMRKLKNNKVVAQCLGGNLVIEKKGNSIYMSGDVIQLN